MPEPTSVSSYSDDQLLVAAQAENPAARNVLFDRFHGLVRSMVARRCPGRAANQPDFVDDVVNQTFTFVLNPTLSRFNPRRGRASQYLYGLTCNAIRTISRQRNPACIDLDNQSRLEVSKATRTAGVVYRNILGSRTVRHPGHDLEAREEVRRVLEGSDQDTGRFVRQHFLDGEPLVGIAARSGISHSTVSRKITGFVTTSRLRLA